MNRNIIVQPGQTLPDIAIQHCGSLSAYYDILSLNGLSFTSDISAGQVLIVPGIAADKRVRQYFVNGGYIPASIGIKDIDEGVSFWGIEYDFIVQ